MNPEFKARLKHESKVLAAFNAKFNLDPILPRFQTPAEQVALMEKSLETGKVADGLVFPPSTPRARID